MELEEARKRFPEQQEDIDGDVWRYRQAGAQGPALIMLPGAQGTSEIFAAQLDELASGMRVYSVFYPGVPDARMLSSGLARLMDRLGLAQANLFGGSFGGYWAQIFATLHADRVASLFVATSFADPTLLQQKGKPLAELIATDASLIREQRMGMVRQMPEGRLRQSLLAMSEGQSAENLKARVVGIAMATPVPAPTLAQSRIVVIDCEDDPVIPEVLRQGVRERYPNAAHYRLQSGGHFPALLNPAELNPILRRHSF